MKLRELAERSGVSTASIKYYIRLGVLPAGEKKNATTSVYDESHLHRLTLITWLRRELDLPMSAISELTDSIADESISNLELMGLSQNLSVTTSGEPPRRGSKPGFAVEVHEALSCLDWPDISVSAVDRVATALKDLSDAGYEVGAAFVLRHARALAEIARENTFPITDGLSRDEICLAVIRGVTLHNRLLLAMSALTHAAMAAQARHPNR